MKTPLNFINVQHEQEQSRLGKSLGNWRRIYSPSSTDKLKLRAFWRWFEVSYNYQGPWEVVNAQK